MNRPAKPLYSSGDPCGRHALRNFATVLKKPDDYVVIQAFLCYDKRNTQHLMEQVRYEGMVTNNPLIGKQVGNYQILAEIDSGSFGSVYQGRHVVFEDDPIVAIKLLHSTLRSQQERTEFIKEAQVLKKLQHPHILRILDAGFQDGIPYLVTEYAVGGSLRDRLLKHKGQPLPLDEATRILTQVGQALHHAHQQHIVHRDLKPENILFNQAGEVLLADFGIAVVLATTHTKLVGLGGTPPYMAPEQFQGLASARSDQYALGCIAYELVTGHRLFSIPNPTMEAYWYHHAKVEPTPPTRYAPQLPLHVEQAILTALAKDRTQRHTDIPTFSKALHTAHKTKEEWLNEGDTLHNLKRYEEAIAAYDQAIRLDPNDAYVYNSKATTLIDLKRYEEALSASNQAIRLDPNSAFAYGKKGLALHNLKQYEEAITAYDQAIRLDPSRAWVYINKGSTLHNLKQYEEALSASNQATRLDPNSAVAYVVKGVALYDLKQYEEAIATYEQAIHLDPNYALAYHNKGLALRVLGKTKEAELAFEKARELGYGN